MTDKADDTLDPIEAGDYNADFSTRVVIRPKDFSWAETGMPGVEYKLFEACCQPYPRRTLLLRCQPGSVIDVQDARLEVEFFVLDGQITDDQGAYPVGTYVRNPDGSAHAHSESSAGRQHEPTARARIERKSGRQRPDPTDARSDIACFCCS